MQSKTLTSKALRLRLQAARALERTLPNHVREAYGVVPDSRLSGPADEAGLTDIQLAARTSLVENGRLTQEELDTLPVEEAVRVALQRLRDQSAALEDEQAAQRTRSDSFGKAPRTLRR